MNRKLFGYDLEGFEAPDGSCGVELYKDGEWLCSAHGWTSFQLAAIDCCRMMRGEAPVYIHPGVQKAFGWCEQGTFIEKMNYEKKRIEQINERA